MTEYDSSKKKENYPPKTILGRNEIYDDLNRSLKGEYGAITKAGIKQGLYQRASQFIGEEIEGLGLIRAKKREIEIKKKLAELEREAGLEERVKEERKEATQHLKADVLLIILAL